MEDNAELESFRRQWREEVAKRTRQTRPDPPKPRAPARTSATSTARGPFPPTRHEATDRKEDDDNEGTIPAVAPQEEITQQVEHLNLGPSDEDAFQSQLPQREPSSAVEHFEKAVQKEQEGSLGDSLQLYRKAYRVRLVDSFMCFGEGADLYSPYCAVGFGCR